MVKRSPASDATALLIDGTATFYAIKEVGVDAQLNYFSFLEVLKEHIEEKSSEHLSSNWRPSKIYFFTSADPSNEGQRKFHDFLRSKVGFNIMEFSPKDASVINPAQLRSEKPFAYTRFDAIIAYTMGALVAAGKSTRLIICSDSWPLHRAMDDAVRQRGAQVTFTFFGQVMDARYHGLFRKDCPIDFLDLDEYTDRLFQKSGSVVIGRPGGGLPGLLD